MKKTKLVTFAVIMVMMLSLNMVASAAGPFFDANVLDIPTSFEITDYTAGTMASASDGTGLAAAVAAAGGQTLAPNREFVEGSPSAWNDEKECASMLFDGYLETKYGSHINDDPYMAVWKYPEAFVAGHILLCTANDNFASPRRMDDGWTLSGSNDGSSWTVIYTGKGEDVDNEDFAWFTIAIPNNTTAYSHYKLFSEFGYDSDGIQYSEVELTKVAAAEPEPAAPAEAPAETPAPAPAAELAPAPAAPAPAQAAPTPAPKTADPITLVAIGSLISAVGVAIARKRK